MPRESLDLRSRLEREMGPTLASDLEPHFTRGSVFLVHPSVELIDVAVAVAEDDLTRVEEWLRDGTLRRPDPPLLETWSKAPNTPFLSVVVQPWVLVQVVAVSPEPPTGSARPVVN